MIETPKYQSLEAPSSWKGFVEKAKYIKRLVATILGFALFGFGGLAICLTVFPVIIMFSKTKEIRRNRVRTVIRHTFKIFLKFLEVLGLIKVSAHNIETLDDLKGCLVICNHPSLIDVVIIMAHVQNIQCVVKKELWSHPILGGIVRAAGYIRNDIAPELFLEDCKSQLKRGENIIIFPEGTRSKPGQPITLLRGLGNLALEACVDIQSLTMDCYPVFLNKGQKWYKIPSKKAVFDLRVGKIFPISNYLGEAPRSIRVRALMRDIQQYYNRYLGYE